MQNGIKRCPVCLKSFEFERQSKTYCGSRCRQRAHRRPSLESRAKQIYAEAESKCKELLYTSKGEHYAKSLVLTLIEHMADDQRRRVYTMLKEDFYRLA